MRLSIRSFALTCAIFWAATVFLMAVAHLIWPSYGTVFVECVASIYPGYEPAGFGSAIVGALYAVVDGWVGGVVFAWLYNLLLGGRASEAAA